MAGQHEALKRTIRAARSNQNIKSDQELALRSGVHLQTIQNWMYGKTTPRPSELSKVAKALDMSMADLMAVYEGRDPEPQPLQDAIRDLVAEMREKPQMADVLAAQTEAIKEHTGAFMALAASIDRAADRVTIRVEDVAGAFEDVLTLLRSQQPTNGDAVPRANGPAR